MTSCAEALLDKHWNGCLPVSIESITDKELYVFTYSQEEYENSCLMYLDEMTNKVNVVVNYTNDTAKKWMSAFCLHTEHLEKIRAKPELKLHFSSEVFKYSTLSHRKYNNFVLELLVPEKILNVISKKENGTQLPYLADLADTFGISKTAMALRLNIYKP